MAFSHEPHKALISDFLDAIEQDRDPAIPGEEALETQRLIEAIMAKGGTVTCRHCCRWPTSSAPG